MIKFRNKYRIESHRMPNWDYSWNGYYYITLLIQNRECLFGNIENGKMILSVIGRIAMEEWYKSFEMRSELILDEFIFMPNHIHAIVIIKNNDKSANSFGLDGTGDADGLRGADGLRDADGLRAVETHGRASLLQPPEPPENNGDLNTNFIENKTQNFHRKPKSLSSFIAGYKSSVTILIDDCIDKYNLPIDKFNRNNKLFQRNYHDRIIRNEKEYLRIKNYIIDNPKKWNDDEFRRL